MLTSGFACYRMYETADGRHLTVAALEPKFFARLCDLLDRPELAERQYDADQEALVSELAVFFRRRPLEEWLHVFEREDVCVGPVATLAEAEAALWRRPRGRPSEAVPAGARLGRSALLGLLAADPPERLLELGRDDPHLVRLARAMSGSACTYWYASNCGSGFAVVDRLKTVPIAFAWPSASRIVASAGPCARSTAACFSPSAVRIADCFCPSAWRIVARFSRSARICFSIESLIDAGGSIAFSSTRFTRIPHFPVASSSTPRSWPLISSRDVSVLLERHAADDVAQRRHRELLDRLDVVRDLVRRGLRVVHLEVDDRVDVHDEVVLGDDRLRRERDDLLAQVDQRPQAVDERHDDREARD